MAAHAFWAVFCSSWRPSQISPTAEKDAAAIPPPIFFLMPAYGRWAKPNYFSNPNDSSDVMGIYDLHSLEKFLDYSGIPVVKYRVSVTGLDFGLLSVHSNQFWRWFFLFLTFYFFLESSSTISYNKCYDMFAVVFYNFWNHTTPEDEKEHSVPSTVMNI